MNYMEYLHDIKAQKQIDKLAKKYKNKKIVFYGAGEYFDIINEYYDLSKLNVVGISDLRFAKQINTNTTKYKAYAPNDLRTLDFDVILLTVFEELHVIPYLKQLLSDSKNKHKKISALINPGLFFYIKTLLTKAF